MTDLRKLLETLEDYVEQALAQHDQQYQRHPSTERDRQVIVNDLEALRTSLAQPEQEPVGWMGVDSYGNVIKFRTNEFGGGTPLYTAPPKQPEQRPVGTYEGVMEAMLSLHNGTLEQQQVYGHMKDKLLYTAPPHHVNDVKKREWVGLTEQDVHDAFKFTELVKQLSFSRERPEWCENFAAYIEAKLKEKNT